MRVANAARMIDVHPRTIYRYIEEGSIFALKIAGKTYRVCFSCLLNNKGGKNRDNFDILT